MQTCEQVIQAALSLPEDQRILVTDALLQSLQSGDAHPLHESWLVEIERRSREYDEGQVVAIPWEEVKASARGRLGLG
jgi:putative addiction module component (TIGR02574 family)